MSDRKKAETLEHSGLSTAKVLIFFIAVPVCLFIFSFANGQYAVAPGDLIRIIGSSLLELMQKGSDKLGSRINLPSIAQTWTEQAEIVVYKIRLPRILGAMMVGASLSAAGVAYQGMFKNPLVSSDILGASSGASFGAALALWLGVSTFKVQVSSFIFGIFAVTLVYVISSKVKDNPVMGLVLTGMLIGTLFSSGTSLLKYLADPNDKLPAITYWLMGSLAKVGFKELKFALIPMFIGLIPLWLIRWKLNLLTMGEEEAKSMGVNTTVLRTIIIICATLVTVSSVAMCGTIGWVGLVVPHLARMIVGHDFKILLPSSIVLGACYMLAVDDIARMLATVEIPLGILTSFVGAPLFIYLILSKRRNF